MTSKGFDHLLAATPDAPLYMSRIEDLRDGEIIGNEDGVVCLIVGPPLARGRELLEVPVQYHTGDFGTKMLPLSCWVPVLDLVPGSPGEAEAYFIPD